MLANAEAVTHEANVRQDPQGRGQGPQGRGPIRGQDCEVA